jgi:hypothetical protein
MPFDVTNQVFWMDLRFSTDGMHFERVVQEGGSEMQGGGRGIAATGITGINSRGAMASEAAAHAAATPAVAIPLGELGTDWNGGLLMGTSQPIVAGSYTYALLEYVNNAPHFAFVFRGMSNMTTAAVQARAETEFFGKLLPTQWPWFQRNNGWEGVASLARNVRIEVGALRYRTEGLVCIKTTAAPAVVMTKLVRVVVEQSQSSTSPGGFEKNVVLTVNYKAGEGGAASVELLDEQGTPMDGYSARGAANISAGADGVALPLVFGAGRALPSDAWLAGVQIRIWINSPSAELYGISFRGG